MRVIGKSKLFKTPLDPEDRLFIQQINNHRHKHYHEDDGNILPSMCWPVLAHALPHALQSDSCFIKNGNSGWYQGRKEYECAT